MAQLGWALLLPCLMRAVGVVLLYGHALGLADRFRAHMDAPPGTQAA